MNANLNVPGLSVLAIAVASCRNEPARSPEVPAAVVADTTFVQPTAKIVACRLTLILTSDLMKLASLAFYSVRLQYSYRR